MEKIKSLIQYIKYEKDKLKNRYRLFEDIIPRIPDETGFMFFSNLIELEEIEKNNQWFIEAERMLMTEFSDAKKGYTPIRQYVLFNLAAFSRAIHENEIWERDNKVSSDPEIEVDIIQEFEDYLDRISGLFFEYKSIEGENTETYRKLQKLLGSVDSGRVIAVAFKMIDESKIHSDLLPVFCTILDRYIEYIGDTEFYMSEVESWLIEEFGHNMDKYLYE